MNRHLLEVDDLSRDEIETILTLSALPQASLTPPLLLAGRGVALVFEKPSLRTRSSTEMAVVALGGHPVYVQSVEVGIDVRETAEDVARTLACYHAALCARVLDHSTLERMVCSLDAQGSGVPVINLLSDRAHPCQALADLLTIRQAFGSERGRVLAYIGDANNVWRSLAQAGAMTGMSMRIAAPQGYGPAAEDLDRIAKLGCEVEVFEDPSKAVEGADVLYTDVWTSMGQEEESAARLKAFAGYGIDSSMLARGAPGAVVMHCLPAHRGEEISAEVLEGPRSLVWRQATNRMHVMRGALAWLFGGSAGERASAGDSVGGSAVEQAHSGSSSTGILDTAER